MDWQTDISLVIVGLAAALFLWRIVQAVAGHQPVSGCGHCRHCPATTLHDAASGPGPLVTLRPPSDNH